MNKLLLTLSITSLIFIAACTKHETITAPVPAKTYPIVGLWIGTQGTAVGSGIDSLYYSFTIEPNNALQVVGSGEDGNTYYAAGTWSLNNTSFTGHITVSNLSQKGIQQTLTGTYDSTQGTLRAGVVHTDGFNYPDNTFSLNRVN